MLLLKNKLNKIGFGGGCHWCTEAVFQVVDGVEKVEQGWITSDPPHNSYSEGVIVHYNESISLEKLTYIHLKTHSSKGNHRFRNKYRSAVYYFNDFSLVKLRQYFAKYADEGVITKILKFHSFKLNTDSYQNYYLNNPDKPFCHRYISPKINLVKEITEKQ